MRYLFLAGAAAVVAAPFIAPNLDADDQEGFGQTKAERCEFQVKMAIADLTEISIRENKMKMRAALIDTYKALANPDHKISPNTAWINHEFVFDGGVELLSEVDKECRAYSKERLLDLSTEEPGTPINFKANGRFMKPMTIGL